jgi:fatty acid desaturase
MKCNSGMIDRAIRVIAGLVLIALAAAGTIGLWGWIGVVPLLTGVVGFCPAYTMLGINTCSAKAKQ